MTDFGLSTGFHKLHDNSYYQNLLNGKSSQSRNRNSVNLDQINLTVSNRGAINDWRKSRRVMAYSTVGTPDYIAPEIFSGNGYGQDCDWWSLGTIMFECQVGWPPFCAEDAHDTYRKIVNWRQSLYFPEDIQLGPEAENLIRRYVDSMKCLKSPAANHYLVLFATLRIVSDVEEQMKSRPTSSSVELNLTRFVAFVHPLSQSYPLMLTPLTSLRMKSTKLTTLPI